MCCVGRYLQRVRANAAARAVAEQRLNAYYCPNCRSHTVTIEIDEGTTPSKLGCRATPGCPGQGETLGYPQPWPRHVPNIPTWEWYRPDPKAFDRIQRDHTQLALAKHLRDGGLLLRRR